MSTDQRKKKGKGEFVTTSRPFEKVALDLIDMSKEGKYLLICIDYFTRFINIEILENKDSESVIDVIKSWCNDGYISENLMSDNGREFNNPRFKLFCREIGIKHYLVGIEDHKANGRVERVIRTIRDGIFKLGDIEFKSKKKKLWKYIMELII